jgi:prepilin-type N-terminal cleavage/methylation domain-containing protein
MSDAGYTLIETLTALVILALAIGGLSAGIQVLARQQATVGRIVAHTQALRAAQAGLDRLFERRGPFRSTDGQRFVGSDVRLEFDCGRPSRCVAQLVQGTAGPALRIEDGAPRTYALRTVGAAHFVYQGALDASPSWPPERLDRQPLRAVSVVRDGSGDTLVKSRLWVEEPVRCEFDVVMQDCR